MVLINLPDEAGNLITNLMPNWNNLGDKLLNSSFVNDRVLILAYHTIKKKLESAYLQNLILKDAFNMVITTAAKPFLKRLMMENIFYHLSSALEVLAHEINGAYGFNIDFNRVQIDHQASSKFCLRCKLDNIQNDPLASYLNMELPQRGKSPIDHWYYNFAAYRNQVVHRTLYVLMLEPGHDYLPDDPAIFDPSSHKPIYDAQSDEYLYPNYTHKRELRTYSDYCFNKILEIAETVHMHLKGMI
jgi:hypothetical protein